MKGNSYLCWARLLGVSTGQKAGKQDSFAFFLKHERRTSWGLENRLGWTATAVAAPTEDLQPVLSTHILV